MILTNEEARQLNDACNEGAANCCETERHGYVKGFDDGIEWALQNLLPSRVQGFAEYCGRLYEEYGETGKWIDRWSRTKVYTTADLYKKYQEYLKHK